ncbi:glycosyl transferase family 2 protein [Paenibacillus selenitireducens]|uniref:Glycosyl transferase family 2 protein n=1 Tax=Paenibacillus selenitireducens TaxID=1324314 RepID=A0A1T2XK09_9BACL|nr:glycosyltransferase family 4 protein [Paenibacillus selenitireducens]OPA80184.1 glycosyl transferase family 2 protein [Paenibacillus selenitireducens]
MTQIIWYGNVHDFTGYAKAARQYVLSLHAMGVDVKVDAFDPHLPAVQLSDAQQQVIQHLTTKRKSPGRKVYIFHQIPEIWRRKLHPSVGFTYWETSKIPDSWVQQANRMHAVFLPSRHNIEVFRSSGVRVPLHYIRPCLFQPESAPSAAHAPKYLQQLPPFRFLSVFSWVERKGYDILLQAFWETFSAADNVALIIKTVGNPEILQQIESMKQKLRVKEPQAPVYVDFDIRSEAEMEALYANCQALVLPSRGEGAGYPLLEAARRGLPVITTGWGGHTDFLTQDNSYLIPYQLGPVKPQSYYGGYQSDQLWAEPSITDLQHLMRTVYEHYPLAQAKGLAAKQYILQHFTPEQAVLDIVNAVQTV